LFALTRLSSHVSRVKPAKLKQLTTDN
jgi:hypothetical protein